MPYIKKDDRDRLLTITQAFDDADIRSAVELNYLITMLAHKYLNQKPENYQSYNDAIGALEGAKLELYRRHIALHNNENLKENGDV
jgi:hypothetical protein